MLISGTKQVVLFRPTDALFMYLQGTFVCRHCDISLLFSPSQIFGILKVFLLLISILSSCCYLCRQL